MTKLVFLGTGGGRFSTIYQIRATGGLYLMDGINMHIDPGPSAAHQMHRVKLDPAKTDAVLVSHSVEGREVAARFAARTRSALAVDAVGVLRDDEGIVASHSVYGGSYNVQSAATFSASIWLWSIIMSPHCPDLQDKHGKIVDRVQDFRFGFGQEVPFIRRRIKSQVLLSTLKILYMRTG